MMAHKIVDPAKKGNATLEKVRAVRGRATYGARNTLNGMR